MEWSLAEPSSLNRSLPVEQESQVALRTVQDRTHSLSRGSWIPLSLLLKQEATSHCSQNSKEIVREGDGELGYSISSYRKKEKRGSKPLRGQSVPRTLHCSHWTQPPTSTTSSKRWNRRLLVLRNRKKKCDSTTTGPREQKSDCNSQQRKENETSDLHTPSR